MSYVGMYIMQCFLFPVSGRSVQEVVAETEPLYGQLLPLYQSEESRDSSGKGNFGRLVVY